ncbi:MAG TPA: calcium-binding protein, partial [Allosphingosinicella sp.]|nr:calcium-binding protein [Allosphingosinicella sp.]
MLDQVALLGRETGEFVVNTVIAGDQLRPVVTKLASGGFVVAWLDESAGAAFKAQVYDSLGAKVGGEIPVNSSAVDPSAALSVAALANGGFVVGWGNSQSRAQIFDAAGAKVGAETVLHAANGHDMRLAGLSGGSFVATAFGGNGQLFDAAGAKVGSGFTVGQGGTTLVTALANGQFVVVAGTYNRSIQLFDANGTKVGAEIQSQSGGSDLGNSVISALPGGGFVLAWAHSLADHHGSSLSPGVRAQIYNSAGAKVGGEIAVNTTTEGTQNEVAVIGLPGGGFLATWTEHSASGTVRTLVKGQVFDAAGAKLGTEFLVGTETDHANANHGQSAVALIGGDRIAVMWHGAGPGDARQADWTLDNIDGGIRGRILKPLSTNDMDVVASRESLSEVTMEGVAAVKLTVASSAINTTYSYAFVSESTGGGITMVGDRLFVSDNDRLDFETAPTATVTVRVTDSLGNVREEAVQFAIADAAAPERRFTAGAETTVHANLADHQSDPSVVRLAGGGFVLVWTDANVANGDGNGASVKARLYDEAGNPTGAEFVVNTLTAGTQSVSSVTALSTGGFAVSWSDASAQGGDTSGTGIALQIFNAAGAKVGGQVLANDTTLGAQSNSSVTALSNGNILVTWSDASATGGDTSGSAVRAQILSASGAKVGGEFLVNTETAGIQTFPASAALPGGGFTVAWRDSSLIGGDDSFTAVKLQRFDASGAKAGGELLVNTSTLGTQDQPAIASLADGTTLVAWRHSGTTAGIHGQLFDASGARIGGEFVIEQGGHSQPRVAARPSGGFLVSWNGATPVDDSGAGVSARLIGPAGEKIGDSFLVNHSTLGTQQDSAVAVLANGTLVVTWHDVANPLNADVKLRLFVPTDLPLARGDSLATDEATVLSANLFADNGSGPDGGADLLVTAVNGSAAAVGQQVTLASGARVTVTAGGGLSYDPSGKFNHLVPPSSGATVNTSATDSFTYTLAGGSTATVTVRISGAASEGDRYFGTLNADHIVGSGFGEVFMISQGAFTIDGALDRFEGRGGDDVFYVGNNFRPNTTIDGGSGFDTLVMQGSNFYAIGTLTGVERVLFLTAADNSYGGAGADTSTGLTLKGGELAGGATLIVDASARLAGETTYFSALSETSGRIVATGGAGADTFLGGAGDDELNGGPGNDILNGGAGADLMRGGLGNDEYTVDNAGDVVDELGGGGYDTVRTTLAAYVLGDGIERLIGIAATGQGLFGNALGNIIEGSGGADLIDGGAGADTMDGMSGSDIYIVDDPNDRVVDTSYSDLDIDEVRTALAAYSLSSAFGIEKLTGTSGAGQALTGSVRGDIIAGGGGDDVITGEGGADLLSGGGGADRFVYLAVSDSRTGAVDRILDFQAGVDKIDVAALGRVTLAFTPASENGVAYTLVNVTRFTAGDTLTIRVDGVVGEADVDAQTKIVGTEGNDTLYGTDQPDEIRGLGGDDGLYGYGGDDRLDGGSGRDLLDGGTGADRMAGGAGDDLYFVDNAGDLVVENADEGNDEVRTALARYTLGDNVERLTGTSNAGQVLTGNALANIIVGGAGNDVLDGGAGADTMTGGDGDDVYIVDDPGDVVNELAGGTDEVRTALKAYALPGGAIRIENLTGLSSEGQTLTGNARANLIVGGAGDDVIEGGGNAD